MRSTSNAAGHGRAPIALALTAALLFSDRAPRIRASGPFDDSSSAGRLPVASFTPGVAQYDQCQTEVCGNRITPDAAHLFGRCRCRCCATTAWNTCSPDEYELDYLITPELGGLADRRNLWPEPYGLRSWNAHAKDALENRAAAARVQRPKSISRRHSARSRRTGSTPTRNTWRQSQPIQLHARVLAAAFAIADWRLSQGGGPGQDPPYVRDRRPGLVFQDPAC